VIGEVRINCSIVIIVHDEKNYITIIVAKQKKFLEDLSTINLCSAIELPNLVQNLTIIFLVLSSFKIDNFYDLFLVN